MGSTFTLCGWLFITIVLSDLRIKLISGKSFKEPTVKDGSDYLQNLGKLVEKLNRLETMLNKTTTALENLKNESNATMTTLENRLDENTQQINNNLISLNQTGLPDSISDPQKPYWSSNNNKETSNHCNSEIRAQTGSIVGIPRTYQITNCLWTIQANYRSWIKLSFSAVGAYAFELAAETPTCAVTEINWGSGTQVFNTTRTTWQKTYLFSGPVLFLQCNVTAYYTPRFSVDFEGFGPTKLENYKFDHLYDTSIHSQTLLTSKVLGKEEVSSVVPEMLTLSFVKPSESRSLGLFIQRMSPTSGEFCSENTTLTVNLALDSALSTHGFIDCCKVDCQTLKLMINPSALVTYTSENPTADEFRFIWSSIEHSSKAIDTTKGGISRGELSGSVYKYSYGVGGGYTINERLVWLIQPYPTSSATFTFNTIDLEYGHDHLTALDIGDDDFRQVSGFSHYATYKFQERTILLIFTSDNEYNKGGFSAKWNTEGPRNVTKMKYHDKLRRYTAAESSAISFNSTTLRYNIGTLTPNVSWPGTHTFVINPRDVAPLSLDLQLNFSIQGPIKLYMLGSKNASFSKLISSEETELSQDGYRHHSGNYTSWDAVFVIVVHFIDGSGNIDLAFKWSKGASTIPEHYLEGQCGGQITAPASGSGRLRYKIAVPTTFGETRCIWNLMCSTSNITLHIVKHGFLSYNGNLVISEIDRTTLHLKNKTTIMNSIDKKEVFEGPMIFITFQTNPVSTMRGFVLEFNCTGDPLDETPINAKTVTTFPTTLNEWRLSYPSVDMDNDIGNSTESEKIFVLSKGVSPYVTYSPTFLASLNIRSSEDQLFEKEGQLSFYTLTANQYRLVLQCSFLKSSATTDDCESFYGKTNTVVENFDVLANTTESNLEIHMNNTGLIAIYQPPLMYRQDSKFGFDLEWGNDRRCGGRINVGEIDHISYKLGLTYSNKEYCVWILEVPGDNLIISYTSGGLELCCDIVSVAPIVDGLIGTSRYMASSTTPITSGTSTGPRHVIPTPDHLAIVTFETDHSVTGTGFRVQLSSSGAPKDYARPRISFSSKLNKKGALMVTSDGKQKTGTSAVSAVIPPNTLYYYEQMTLNMEKLHLYASDNGSPSCDFDSLRIYRHIEGISGLTLDRSFRPYADLTYCNDSTSTDETQTHPHYDLYGSGTGTSVKQCRPECYNSDMLNVNAIARASRRTTLTPPFVMIYNRKSNFTEDQPPHADVLIRWGEKIEDDVEETTNSTGLFADDNGTVLNDTSLDYSASPEP